MVDKACLSCESVQPLGGVGAPGGIGWKVTPVMIDAGVDVFTDTYPETGTGDFMDRRMIKAIYRAMRLAGLEEVSRMNE